MEHFYNSIISGPNENWFNYQDLYSDMVKKFPTNSHFVEVGVWKGMSACYMAVEIKNSNKQIKFDCVDTWDYEPIKNIIDLPENMFDSLYDIFIKNIEPVKDLITIKRGLSYEVANQYENNSLDFIFIDAGHDYNSVTKDLTAWYPKLKENGVIAGHDYHNNGSNAVKSAVDNFFNEENIIEFGQCWIKKYL